MTVQDVRPGSLLCRLAGPEDVKNMPADGLPDLAAEIRAFLVEKVCRSGGHLGGNLGVVELTIALHRVFDSPRDVLLFDTGHQAYVHKLLTGRMAGFDTLRQAGGLSGYPHRSESPHDWIENSHASTALSYADGIAKAFRLRRELGNSRRVVAVLGDGALTGGLAWEGLNNLAAAPDRPLVVVLNDNGRSYEATIGGIAGHLSELRGRCRHKGQALPVASPVASPVADPSVFEQLGLAYLGPVDGHDLADLEAALRHAASLNRTVVVHVVTEKGRGYGPAEADVADRMHGIGVLDPFTGRPCTPGKRSWTHEFAEQLAVIGQRRPDVVAVTAAMLHPVGLSAFAQRFPDRTFDVGIAEQQAVCSAAGLAMAGLHPVVAVYATFLNRAFDQVLMDVALHKLPVTFVLDRAGITGPDGASHHGMWDPAILGIVPGMAVAAPRDPARLRELLDEAISMDGPTAIRFPKADATPDLPPVVQMDGIDILHRSGGLPADILVIACGVMAGPAIAAARQLNAHGIGATVIDPRWVQPINPSAVHLAARYRLAITVEDTGRAAGFGTAFTLACADTGVATPIRVLGLPQHFVHHGDRAGLLAAAGLTAAHITARARDALHTTRSQS